MGVRIGVCPGVGLARWLRWSAHPLSGIVCRGTCVVPCFPSRHPVFAPSSLEMAVELIFCRCCLFVSFGPEFINCTAYSYFQFHTVSLYLVALGELCPGASTAVKGLRSHPACLKEESMDPEGLAGHVEE